MFHAVHMSMQVTMFARYLYYKWHTLNHFEHIIQLVTVSAASTYLGAVTCTPKAYCSGGDSQQT